MKISLKRIRPSVDGNRYATILLSSAVWFVPLRDVLIKLGNMLHEGWGRVFSKLSIGIFFVLIVFPALRRLKYTKSFMGWFAFVMLSWTISLGFHIEYSGIWISEAVDIFVRALPFYLFVQNIDDWTAAKKVMYRSGVIGVIIMLIYVIIGHSTGTLFVANRMYSQYNGIATAGAATFCILAFLEEKKLLYLLMTVISVVLIVLFGARMPIACLLLGFGLYLLINFRGKLKVTRKSIVLPAIIVIGIVFVGIAIVRLQSMNFSYINAGQRILYKISNGEFFESKGRSQIAAATLESIFDRPLAGFGMISDRIPIARIFYGDESEFIGTYSHNIFLEFWLQYGLILGTILISIVLYATYRLIFKNNFTKDKMMIAIWAVSMTFGILLFSGPNYSRKEFWIVLGMGSPYLFGRYQRRIK